jgi:hypothetical protein
MHNDNNLKPDSAQPLTPDDILDIEFEDDIPEVTDEPPPDASGGSTRPVG